MRAFSIFSAIMAFCFSLHAQDRPRKVPTNNPMIGDVRSLAPVTGSWNPTRFEEGYVLGTLARVSSRGVIIQTLEGEIKLGVTSTRGGYIDTDCFDRETRSIPQENREARDQRRQRALQQCTVVINPWPFSHLNERLLTNFEQISGQLLMVFYRTYMWVPFTDTNNYISHVYFVNPELLKIGDVYDASHLMPVTRTFHYATGIFEGRIVKAAMEGVVRKTYELIIQLGNTGDIFHQVSVSDKRLFDFALKAMSTGHYLRISYFQLYSPFAFPVNLVRGYNTKLRVYRIEVTEDPRMRIETEVP